MRLEPGQKVTLALDPSDTGTVLDLTQKGARVLWKDGEETEEVIEDLQTLDRPEGMGLNQPPYPISVWRDYPGPR